MRSARCLATHVDTRSGKRANPNVALTRSILGIVISTGKRSELAEDHGHPMMLQRVYDAWVERMFIAMMSRKVR